MVRCVSLQVSIQGAVRKINFLPSKHRPQTISGGAMNTDKDIMNRVADLVSAHGPTAALEIALRRAAALELNPQDTVARAWSKIAEAISLHGEGQRAPRHIQDAA